MPRYVLGEVPPSRRRRAAPAVRVPRVTVASRRGVPPSSQCPSHQSQNTVKQEEFRGCSLLFEVFRAGAPPRVRPPIPADTASRNPSPGDTRRARHLFMCVEVSKWYQSRKGVSTANERGGKAPDKLLTSGIRRRAVSLNETAGSLRGARDFFAADRPGVRVVAGGGRLAFSCSSSFLVLGCRNPSRRRGRRTTRTGTQIAQITQKPLGSSKAAIGIGRRNRNRNRYRYRYPRPSAGATRRG